MLNNQSPFRTRRLRSLIWAAGIVLVVLLLFNDFIFAT